MKLKFPSGRQYKGGRIRYVKNGKLRRSNLFIGVTCYDGYWWHEDSQKWEKDCRAGANSHFDDCHTVKAFRRRLKQWSKYLPKGTNFQLVSLFYFNSQPYVVNGKTT